MCFSFKRIVKNKIGVDLEGWSLEGAPGRPKCIGTFKFEKMFLHDVHNNPTKGFGPIAFGLEYICEGPGVEQTFPKDWFLDKFNFLDEGKIPYKGSFRPVQIYDPDKPIKWGPKLFMGNDSNTGYCWAINIFH